MQVSNAAGDMGAVLCCSLWHVMALGQAVASCKPESSALQSCCAPAMVANSHALDIIQVGDWVATWIAAADQDSHAAAAPGALAVAVVRRLRL